MMDSILHKKWTGSGNERILHNSGIAETGIQIIIRIPLIGGVNDTDENIELTAKFISNLAGHKKRFTFCLITVSLKINIQNWVNRTI